MSGLIVIVGIDQFAAAERWSRLIEPLAAELEASGLGEIPGLAAFREQFRQMGSVDAHEFSVRLVNFNYGRELVDRVLEAAGLDRRVVVQPEAWRGFHCEDYFALEYARLGYWDETGQYWYIEPFERVFENEEAGFLDVGGAGVDGIRFGYRRGQSGFWAYPVDGEYVFLADTVTAFIQGWLSGTIRM